MQDESFVPNQMAKALGLREQLNVPILEALLEFLRARHLLIVLDNCEHLIEASARLAEVLLSACDGLHILATSREALNIRGEQTYFVAPLGLPRPAVSALANQVMEFSAVRLFVERARLADPRFEMNDRNVLPIAQICMRLDGIPLALELAAARVRQLGVSEIASNLDSRFDLLAGTRTAVPRQQTLRALVDWSYDLLTPQERLLFTRLAVFVGGWTLESAEHVCADERLPRTIILDLLLRLVDKSLVIVSNAETSRYMMLETIREYAREKLAATNELALWQARHYHYFTELTEAAEPELRGLKRIEWGNRLEVEQPNLRAALDWALAQSDSNLALRLTGALHFFLAAT